MDANQLRRAFTDFFVERDHVAVASAGLIPHHPRAPLFTNAGMNQFIPYFLGEEIAPFKRATTVQKCVRIRGKHDDIELIGRTTRHLTFFEMLGNFSFGDYFKAEAIPWAWEFLTEKLKLDAERLWVTVFTEDDDASAIWHEQVGVPLERIQRMGEDNFWEMGDTGPCGPSSEIYFDRGPSFGEEGGPAHGGEERYVEIWNLVFPQFDRQPDGSLPPLPHPGIDTGAGLERVLSVIQDVPSVWETDQLRTLIAAAERLTGRRYGDDPETDVALRILGDHARSMTFLINDGVFPSNEDRGYVLRRLIRRAVRQAYQLDVERAATPELVGAAIEVMGEAYPELVTNADFILSTAGREESRFRATLRSGLAMLEDTLAGASEVPGEVAFRLHDTHGFPIELTREIAAEAGVGVDEAGFEAAMAAQRQQSKEAGKGRLTAGSDLNDLYRSLLAEHGPTDFVGYTDNEANAVVLAVAEGADPEGKGGRLEIFLDRTPFYAEGGGQVGDTGVVETDSGRARVVDTTYALPGLIRHVAVVEEGSLDPGQTATASIDAERRAAIRRNHTATHLLHWALRHVLGSHVKQHGSVVAPDRLRFDFSHYGAVTPEQLRQIEDLVNGQILDDADVSVDVMSKAAADASGAIAFFDEKYGETVRVISAGADSREFCGGTHVSRLGQIGAFDIVSEGSIGANLRRVEATTGTTTLERLREDEGLIASAAGLLKVRPDELVGAIQRRLDDQRRLEERLRAVQQASLVGEARTLAAQAVDRIVVARRDELAPDALRELASQIRQVDGVETVVLGGSPDGSKAALVAMVPKGAAKGAPELVSAAARMVGGGGGGKNPEVAQAGGRDASRLDEALDAVRGLLGLGTRPVLDSQRAGGLPPS